MSKSYFISFANELFSNQLNRLTDEAKETGWFDKVIGETPETIKDIIDKHPKAFLHKRGFGYWLWKPYILLNQLSKIDEGDDLFYTDAGSRILPHRHDRFLVYKDILGEQPIWTSGTQHILKAFTKMSLLKRFNAHNNNSILNAFSIESGFLAIRKCNESMEFLEEWLSICMEDDYKYITDELYEEQLSEFIDHRHDQSVLDLLIKTKDYLWFDEDCYGVGPFFHSRMTDEGPRKYAPDWWRTEPDYDRNKHFLVGDYLQSKKDSNWWKKQKDYNPDTMHNMWDYLNHMYSIYANGSRFDDDHPSKTHKNK